MPTDTLAMKQSVPILTGVTRWQTRMCRVKTKARNRSLGHIRRKTRTCLLLPTWTTFRHLHSEQPWPYPRLKRPSSPCSTMVISLIRRFRQLGQFCRCCNVCRRALTSQSVRRRKPRQFMHPERRIDKTRLRIWRYPPRKHNVPSPVQLDAELKADETSLFIHRGFAQAAMCTFKLFLILTAGGAIYPMLPKRLLLICFLGCSVLATFACASDNVNHSTVCHLPKPAEGVLEAKLPGWKIVSASDLTEHDRALWNAKHSHVCPGVADGDYFGDRHVSYAVTLVNRQPTNMLQTLVVLRPQNGSYELIELSKAQEASRVLVVFRLRPATFEDIETGERTRTASDSIAYEDIAAGMLVYASQKGKFKEIQVSE